MNFLNLTSLFVFSGLALLIAGVFFLNRRSTRHLHQQLAELAQSEKNYRALVKSLPSIIFK
ncbi:MAG: hypothetical protein M1438_06090, partial [Deltaproteobacteria bacterium]|nr:hypothetical protein [Deltaproteobacteria bacterium]